MTKLTTHNSTFAIGGVSCSADSFVIVESYVLRIKLSSKNPAHRKSANRYNQWLKTGHISKRQTVAHQNFGV